MAFWRKGPRLCPGRKSVTSFRHRGVPKPDPELTSPSWTQTPTRSQSERGPRPLPTSSDFPPAGALLLFIFKNPPPSPHDQPWSTRTTDARRASDQSRERSSQAPPPEIVDERPALLGMNCAMLRKLAGPRSARRAQRTHWRRMFGAQVDTNPSHLGATVICDDARL